MTKTPLKVVSLLLLISFFSLDLVYAVPMERNVIHPARFEPPLDFCTLKEIHAAGTGRPYVIHIQDAHSNLSGQENLASTLDDIVKKYGVSQVFVEGGAVDGTLSPLKKIAPPEAIKRAAKSLLIEGKISGEEYLSLVSDRPMKITGVEDMKLYYESVRSYAELADKREAILEYLKTIQTAIDKLKRKLYPIEILDYENGRDGETPYQKLLKLADTHAIDLKDFPAIRKLKTIQDKEKDIDFDRANLEQAALIEEIEKRGAAEKLKNHLDKVNRMKNSRASQFSYFQKILDIAKEKNVPTSDYANLALYGEYLREFSSLDLDEVLDEMERLEDKAYLEILSNNVEAGFKPAPTQNGHDARLLRSIDRYTVLLNTAYRIQMSTKEFNFFKANEPDFATVSYLAFLNRKLAEEGYFEELIPYNNLLEEGKKSLESFYDSVSRRDAAFITNMGRLLATGRTRSQQVAVLITGGYHTSHLKKLFKEKGYSYAVLAPLVTSETNQEKYENLLLSVLDRNDRRIHVQDGKFTAKGPSTQDIRFIGAVYRNIVDLVADKAGVPLDNPVVIQERDRFARIVKGEESAADQQLALAAARLAAPADESLPVRRAGASGGLAENELPEETQKRRQILDRIDELTNPKVSIERKRDVVDGLGDLSEWIRNLGFAPQVLKALDNARSLGDEELDENIDWAKRHIESAASAAPKLPGTGSVGGRLAASGPLEPGMTNEERAEISNAIYQDKVRQFLSKNSAVSYIDKAIDQLLKLRLPSSMVGDILVALSVNSERINEDFYDSIVVAIKSLLDIPGMSRNQAKEILLSISENLKGHDIRGVVSYVSKAVGVLKIFTNENMSEILIGLSRYSGKGTLRAFETLRVSLNALRQIPDMTQDEMKEILLRLAEIAKENTYEVYAQLENAVQLMLKFALTKEEIRSVLIEVVRSDTRQSAYSLEALPDHIKALGKIPDASSADILAILNPLIRQSLAWRYEDVPQSKSLDMAISSLLKELPGITKDEIKNLLIIIASEKNAATAFYALPGLVRTLKSIPLEKNDILEILRDIILSNGPRAGHALISIDALLQSLRVYELPYSEIKELIKEIHGYVGENSPGAYKAASKAVAGLGQMQGIDGRDIKDILTQIAKNASDEASDAYENLVYIVENFTEMPSMTKEKKIEFILAVSKRSGPATGFFYSNIHNVIYTLGQLGFLFDDVVRLALVVSAYPLVHPFLIKLLERFPELREELKADYQQSKGLEYILPKFEAMLRFADGHPLVARRIMNNVQGIRERSLADTSVEPVTEKLLQALDEYAALRVVEAVDYGMDGQKLMNLFTRAAERQERGKESVKIEQGGAKLKFEALTNEEDILRKVERTSQDKPATVVYVRAPDQTGFIEAAQVMIQFNGEGGAKSVVLVDTHVVLDLTDKGALLQLDGDRYWLNADGILQKTSAARLAAPADESLPVRRAGASGGLAENELPEETQKRREILDRIDELTDPDVPIKRKRDVVDGLGGLSEWIQKLGFAPQVLKALDNARSLGDEELNENIDWAKRHIESADGARLAAGQPALAERLRPSPKPAFERVLGEPPAEKLAETYGTRLSQEFLNEQDVQRIVQSAQVTLARLVIAKANGHAVREASINLGVLRGNQAIDVIGFLEAEISRRDEDTHRITGGTIRFSQPVQGPVEGFISIASTPFAELTLGEDVFKKAYAGEERSVPSLSGQSIGDLEVVQQVADIARAIRWHNRAVARLTNAATREKLVLAFPVSENMDAGEALAARKMHDTLSEIYHSNATFIFTTPRIFTSGEQDDKTLDILPRFDNPPLPEGPFHIVVVSNPEIVEVNRIKGRASFIPMAKSQKFGNSIQAGPFADAFLLADILGPFQNQEDLASLIQNNDVNQILRHGMGAKYSTYKDSIGDVVRAMVRADAGQAFYVGIALEIVPVPIDRALAAARLATATVGRAA